MNTHKAFILGVALLSTIGVKAQFAIDNYKAVFTSSPQHVPTTKTPDAPLAGNGDIGITMGGTPDKLCFYIGKNDFWRAYPVYPGGIALPDHTTYTRYSPSQILYHPLLLHQSKRYESTGRPYPVAYVPSIPFPGF